MRAEIGREAARVLTGKDEMKTRCRLTFGTTAVGPRSDATMAASGSDVLRHSQFEPGDCELALVWCIGHGCPSLCGQLHASEDSARDDPKQSAAGDPRMQTI
jgi:hypothetical protein